MKLKYKTVIISDIHLGTKDSKAFEVIDFLNKTSCEVLILNGDIIDGWAIKRGSKWTNEHMKCVRKILKKSQKTKVYWIKGNHDDFLLDFIPISLGSIEIKENLSYIGIDGKKYIITHGDIFDIFITDMKWLAKIGSIGYDLALWINRWYNRYRRFRNLEYLSLSQKIKQSVKQATSFIGKFEEHLVQYAKNNGYDGVICGHIHEAKIKTINNISYFNSGDWIEGLTALVETLDGKWQIVTYKEFKEQYFKLNFSKNIQ